MKIKINGNEYGVYWGMPALAEASEILKCDFESVIGMIMGDSKFTGFQLFKAKAVTLLCAVRCYNRVYRLPEPDLTIEEIEFFCDTTTPEEFEPIRESFFNSVINGKKVSEALGLKPATDESGKKKLPSTKKSSSFMKSDTNPGK